MVTVRQLEVLCAIIETSSVTAASHRLNLSQPAVSKLLASLEHEVKLQLFRRGHRSLAATPEALRLYEEARRLLLGLTDVSRLAQELRSLTTGTLKVASLVALGRRILPLAIAEFLKERPAVNVTFQVRDSSKVLDWVISGQIDFGIAQSSIEHDAVETVQLCSVPGVCILPPGHRLAGQAWISAEDLDGEPFVSFGPEGTMLSLIDQTFEALKVRRRITLQVYNSSNACSLVLQGLGVSVVEPFSASDFAAEGLVVKPFRPVIPFEFRLFFPRARERSGLLQAFLPILNATVRRAVAGHPAIRASGP